MISFNRTPQPPGERPAVPRCRTTRIGHRDAGMSILDRLAGVLAISLLLAGLLAATYLAGWAFGAGFRAGWGL